MKHPSLVEMVLISLACCSCAPTPVRYYTLVQPIPASSQVAAAECCRVHIGRVHIPPQVDRAEIVTLSGDDQATVLGNDLWLAPLRDEIGGALSSQISLKLSEIADTHSMSGLAHSVVMVNITRFESMPAQYAFVAANWRIQAEKSPKVISLTCETTARVAITSGVPALVHGYQQAIAKIGDQIALTIQDAGPGAAIHCPNG